MDTGNVFTVKKQSFGKQDPIDGWNAMQAEINFIMKVKYYMTDEGVIIFPKHISSISNDPPMKEKEKSEVLKGSCSGCGQMFIEETRIHPRIGFKWEGILSDHMDRGCCPKCYHDYGVINRCEVRWSESDWILYSRVLIRESSSAKQLMEFRVANHEHVESIYDEFIEKEKRLHDEESDRVRASENKKEEERNKRNEKKRELERQQMELKLQNGFQMFQVGKDLMMTGDLDGALNIMTELRRDYPNTDLSTQAQKIQEELIEKKIGK